MRTATLFLLLLVASTSGAVTFDHYVASLAEGSGFDVVQVHRLWKEESGRKCDEAISDSGAIGRWQIRLSTARDYDKSATVEKLKDKWYSSRIAFKHFRSLTRQLAKRGYSGQELRLLVLASWNRGLGKVLKSIARGHSGINHFAHTIFYGPPVPMFTCMVHAPQVQVLSCVSVSF